MPEMSESPEIIYCATVLAKTCKDADAFANLHDLLGSLYDASQLAKIEELASKYTELPELVLDCKLDWLLARGVEPFKLDTIIGSNSGVSKKQGASKGDGAAKLGCEKAEKPAVLSEDSPSQSKTPTTNSKKKNKKGKKKKNEDCDGTMTMNVKVDKEQEDLTLKVETEETVPVVSSISSAKRKKKKKSKSSKKQQESKPENNVGALLEVAKLQSSDEKTSEQQSSVEGSSESKSPDGVTLEYKSPDEGTSALKSPDEPVLPLTLDSGIGSCVASGGEDKSSVLSGETVESAGDGAELLEPTLNFEWDGNVINEFLQSKNIYFENPGKDFDGKHDDSSTRFEISFGTFFGTEKTDDKQKQKLQRKTLSKPKKIKNKTQKTLGNKSPAASIVTLAKSSNKFNITFGTQHDTISTKSLEPKTLPNAPSAVKTSSNASTFDYKSAVKFLWEEWIRTVENPLTKYV